jgi:hypothetical protein
MATQSKKLTKPQIEFYQLYEDYLPKIEQASPRREWMDRTTDKHPYKCIPVTRANAHGWTIRLPHDVVVQWDGGEGSGNLQVLEGLNIDNGINMVDTSLGSGVLSFHAHMLIKTPKPYNLYVTGAPNELVKGAVPLTGVVETWWSPYTFTMNWKLRYVNRPVLFPKGLGFVHFFPVNSIELEQWETVVKPVQEHPHASEHLEWANDRFVNPQKRHDYYKHGVDPSGCPIADPEFHKLKLSLQEPKLGETDGRASQPKRGK